MEFAIDKKVFGTSFHLHCLENGRNIKVNELPKNCLIVGSPEYFLLSKLYNFSCSHFPPKKYKRPFEEMKNGETIPWELVLPKKIYVQEIKNYIQTTRETLKNLDLFYYHKTFKKNSLILDNLVPAKIDISRYFVLISKTTDNLSNLKSFMPQKGMATIPYYSRIKTKTGRLSVIKGPNILHLKKEHRNILTSRHGTAGKIFYLDYTSLEPRILLAVNGGEDIPKDVYQAVLDDLNYDIPREAVKQSIISRLYGAGTKSIEKQLKNLVDYPRDVVKIIDEYFGVEELKQRLVSEFYRNKGKCINNYYGRPIHCEGTEPYVLLNNFIQSTAVDVALFGFSQVVEKIKEADISHLIAPIFVLHDGIFLDVKKEVEHLIPKLCKIGSYDIPRFENTNFELDIESEY